jgi:hypothetical protein
MARVIPLRGVGVLVVEYVQHPLLTSKTDCVRAVRRLGY